MNTQDVQEVLDAQQVLAENNIVGEPKLIAALLDWKRGNGAPVVPEPDEPVVHSGRTGGARGAVAQRAARNTRTTRATRVSTKGDARAAAPAEVDDENLF